MQPQKKGVYNYNELFDSRTRPQEKFILDLRRIFLKLYSTCTATIIIFDRFLKTPENWYTHKDNFLYGCIWLNIYFAL